MRSALDRLLHDVTLVTLAIAIALGWSLYQVAKGVADVVSSLLTHYPQEELLTYIRSQPLTWGIHGRILTLSTLLSGVIELGIVLTVALLIRERIRRSS